MVEKGTSIKLDNNALGLTCAFGANGKLVRKTENVGGRQTAYAYEYDDAGHLTRVMKNGQEAEVYQYSPEGRRCVMQRESASTYGQGPAAFTLRGASVSSNISFSLLRYDAAGKLTQAGSHTHYVYNQRGALRERHHTLKATRYVYGDDTMLDRVTFPDGGVVRYEYSAASPFAPAKRFKNKELTAEFFWDDRHRLAEYKSYEQNLGMRFQYGKAGLHSILFNRLRIPLRWPDNLPFGLPSFSALANMSPGPDLFGRLLQGRVDAVTLLCGCDQVGTPKVFSDVDGTPFKELEYDSFGNLLRDSRPLLFIPVGFAGGLTDPGTGFVRFGWRDYDPYVGRFTAPDPKRDMRVDGDLYDYCADDPVTLRDPDGLWWRPWDESRVPRDNLGRFMSNGSGASGGNKSYGLQKSDSGASGAKGSMSPLTPASQKVGKEEWQRAQDRQGYPLVSAPGASGRRSARGEYVGRRVGDKAIDEAVKRVSKIVGLPSYFVGLFERISGMAAIDNIFLVAEAIDAYSKDKLGKDPQAKEMTKEALKRGWEAVQQLPGRMAELLEKTQREWEVKKQREHRN